MTETKRASNQKEAITPQEYAAGRDVGRTYATDEYVTPGSAAQSRTASSSAGQSSQREGAQSADRQRGASNQGETTNWSTTTGQAPQPYSPASNQAFATPAYGAAGSRWHYEQERRYQPQPHNAPNVDPTERQIAVVAGGLLLAHALFTRSRTSVLTGALGAALLWHGQSQRSPLYDALQMNTARTPLWGNGNQWQPQNGGQREQGGQRRSQAQSSQKQEERPNTIEIERAVTVYKPAAELYNYWRKLENLPNFMQHLQKVEERGEKQSHWEARLAGGLPVSWDAEIIEEKPYERIAWQTLPDAQVQQHGEVTFKSTSDERETIVKVNIKYTPPGGIIGETFAQLLNGITAQQVKDDISRFKSLMETGEIATTEGQSSGRA